MNNRGIFFTILVIVLISIFIVSYALYASYGMRGSVEKRIETLDSFVKTIEEDIPRHIYVAGYRFLFLSEKRIFEHNAFLTNTELRFQEAFYNGTFYGEPASVMDGARFSDMQNLFGSYANQMNANITLTNYSIHLTQTDPWSVDVIFTARLIIEDKNNNVKWDKTETFTSKVPIKNFEDPVYIVGTNGKVTPKIIQTNFTTFVSGSDVSNLSTHLAAMTYIAASDAPSFLQRLQGNLSGSQFGIESLVNLAALQAQDIPVYQKSIVDHVYFSTQNPSSCVVRPAGLPSWFRLDNIDPTHLAIYNVTC